MQFIDLIINVKSGKSYDIYCGRANKTYNLESSIWANPFVIGRDGDRKQVINKYRLWINSQPDLLRKLSEIKGKRLACWCNYPIEDCHLSVLHDLANSKWIKNWFSNMLPFDTPMLYQNVHYKTVENFYQAMKIPKDKVEKRAAIAALNPYEAKKAIRDKNRFPWRVDWNKEMSVDVMRYALNYKFQRGAAWHDQLMLTEDWEIVEWNTWGDTFWGRDLYSGHGENMLGKLLMEIRNGIN